MFITKMTSVPPHDAARPWRDAGAAAARQHGAGADRAEQDGRGAGRAGSASSTCRTACPWATGSRRPKGRCRSCRRRCSRCSRSRTGPPASAAWPTSRRNLVKGGGDHARSAGTFLTCVPFKVTTGADVLARGLDGPDRGAGTGEGNAAGVARARHRVERDARHLRRRRELRLHEHDRVAHADHAAADRERPARRVRAAVRHQRQHRSRRAAGPHAARPQHPRLGRRAKLQRLERTLGRGDQAKLAEYLDSVRDVERRIQMAEEQNSRELPVVDSRRASRATTRAREADDGPAGAGVSDRHDPRQHVHAGARGQRPRLSGDRRVGLAPPALAPPGRAGQARAAAQDQRVSLPAVRAIWSRSWPTTPEGDGTMLDHTLSSTARASATATRTSTTTCRSRRRRQGGGHQGRPLHPASEGNAAGEPARHACSTSSGSTSTSSATAPARFDFSGT